MRRSHLSHCLDAGELALVWRGGWVMGLISQSKGHVYFLAADNGLTKIGCTTNLDRRIRQLKAGLPMKARLVYVFESNNITGWENYFHDRYYKKRKHGEWFELSAYDLDELAEWVYNVCEPTEDKIPDYDLV